MTRPAVATIEIGMVNDLREIAGVAAKIDNFCASRQLSPEVAYAVNLAIEELLAITIEKGYQDDDPHRIEVILRQEGDTLVVILVDDADPADPTAPDGEGGGEGDGLGLLLVNQMMDELAYQRRADCNVVTLTKSTTT